MSVICRSTVGGISVYCRWYIGQLLVVYRSTVVRISVCVNLSGESNGFFFLSKDVINYCYHVMGEHVRGAITLLACEQALLFG